MVKKEKPEHIAVADVAIEKFEGAVSGKYENYEATYPVLKKDGSVRWILAKADVPEREPKRSGFANDRDIDG